MLVCRLLDFDRIKIFVFVDAGHGLDSGLRVLVGDGLLGAVVSHSATIKRDGEFFIASDQQEIIGVAVGGQRGIWARKSLHITDCGVALTFDDYGMDAVGATPHVGDNRALGDLPVAVESACALLVDSYAHAVEVEVGQLAIAVFAKQHSAVNSKGEDVNQLRVVGVVNGKREGGLAYHRVNYTARERTAKLTHIRGIDVAVQHARNVVAVVDADELAATG